MSLTPVTINVNGLRDNRKHTHIHIQYIPTHSINMGREAAVVVIVWLLDLQLSPLML